MERNRAGTNLDSASGAGTGLCVAQVIGSFGGGGAQRLAFNLAVGMKRQGIRSLGIALRAEGNYAEGANHGCSLFALKADPANPLSVLNAFLALRRLLREERVDLMHVHGAPSLPFVVLATCFMRSRPKVVFTWQDSESVLDKEGISRQLMIWALRRCAAVSGSSRLVARKLAERAGLANVGVFHGGVPLSKEPEIRSSSAPLILWLGRIVPAKDPQILIRAAARLRDEGYAFKVCIAGKPIPSTVWYMDETRELIRKLQLEEIVSAPGFVSDADLQDIMSRAEISVQTSHTEGLSIALMEHMMAGIAMVATDVGDTSIAVIDGDTGLLIPPKDEDLLTDALRKMLNSSDQRLRFAAAGRKLAEREFSIEAVASRVASQYASVVSSVHAR